MDFNLHSVGSGQAKKEVHVNNLYNEAAMSLDLADEDTDMCLTLRDLRLRRSSLKNAKTRIELLHRRTR